MNNPYFDDPAYRRGWDDAFQRLQDRVGVMHHDAFCAALGGLIAQYQGGTRAGLLNEAIDCADAYIDALKAREGETDE